MITFCFVIRLFLFIRNAGASAQHSSIGQNVIVSMKASTNEIINSVDGRDLSRDEIATILTKKLKSFSKKSQSEVVSVLEGSGAEFQSYWISNQIFVKEASHALIKSIKDLPEVKSVEKEEFIPLDLVSRLKMAKQPNGTEWNLKVMEVEKVWKKTKGEGVIVAIIDSGVRGSHEALKNNYIGTDNYGWYDPLLFTKEPQDLGGHGSHVMGIIAGSNGIGAAPESKWMACRASITLMMAEHAVTACAQYILCPSDPSGEKNCKNVPHLVNNSWGKGGGKRWFVQVVKAWNKVGIKPFFAAGNDGPECKTMASPGDYDDVIAVGSTDRNDTLHESSSRGPVIITRRWLSKSENETNDENAFTKGVVKTIPIIRKEPIVTDKIKPDIVAPGVRIKSAERLSDSSYQFKTGTSMAAPAAAGVAALLLSIKPEMTLKELKNLLFTTTDKDSLFKKASEKSLLDSNSETERCGDIPEDEFPNNFYGHGRINAYKAYKKLKRKVKG